MNAVGGKLNSESSIIYQLCFDTKSQDAAIKLELATKRASSDSFLIPPSLAYLLLCHSLFAQPLSLITRIMVGPFEPSAAFPSPLFTML